MHVTLVYKSGSCICAYVWIYAHLNKCRTLVLTTGLPSTSCKMLCRGLARALRSCFLFACQRSLYSNLYCHLWRVHHDQQHRKAHKADTSIIHKRTCQRVSWLSIFCRMSMPVRLRLNTSKSARAPAASRLGSLWRTNPLYLSHPDELQ